MDIDFANLFVQKQRDVINDQSVKILMLETKLSLLEQQAAKPAEPKVDVNALQAELEKQKQENKQLKTDLAAAQVQLTKIKQAAQGVK